MNTHTIIDSPIGELTLVNTDGVLSKLYMQAHTHRTTESYFGERASDGFEEITAQMGEYFAGRRTEFTLPLAPIGNDFQKRVWRILREIPYGQTRSYGDLATALGDRTLARAVGAANARNPIGIVVPCHRVIGADGSLTGFAGGLERKRFLLELENPARVSGQLPF